MATSTIFSPDLLELGLGLGPGAWLLLLAAAALLLWAFQDLIEAHSAMVLAELPWEAEDGPLLSVLIPVRNDTRRLRPLLEGLAVQRYPRFEVIVVDDHSTDGTRALAESYAPRLPQLRVLTAARLPEGWAGKSWACAQAAHAARGEHLLFLDPDVTPRPGFLTALVHAALERDIDLLTLQPAHRVRWLPERAALTAFQRLLHAMHRPRAASDTQTPLIFGSSPCRLFRREAYESIGGHFLARGSLLEDVGLAERLRFAGGTLEVADGHALVEARSDESEGELSERLSERSIALVAHAGLRAIVPALRETLVGMAPWVLVPLAIAGPGPAWASFWVLGAVSASLLVREVLLRREFPGTSGASLLHAPGLLVVFGFALRGYLRLRRGGGLRWKGRLVEARLG